MYHYEKDFEDEVYQILKKDRVAIERQFKPFKGLNYSIDIKSLYNEIEEWRELKIIYYKNGTKSIQNLWKGFGKVVLLQELKYELILDSLNHIEHILTLPEFDLERIPESVVDSMLSYIKIEKLISKNEKLLRKVI